MAPEISATEANRKDNYYLINIRFNIIFASSERFPIGFQSKLGQRFSRSLSHVSC